MTDSSARSVEELVAALASKDAVERETARDALVPLGSAAVPALLIALTDERQHVRWEAAKAFEGIADPATAVPLVEALADEDPDVRWVIGEALIAIGRDAIQPTLEMLSKSKDSEAIYKGGHHVLHDLAKVKKLTPLLTPVLDAFDQPEPEVSVPLAAEKALRTSFAT